jgi:hypothetical protein
VTSATEQRSDELMEIAKAEFTPLFDGLVIESGFYPNALPDLSLGGLTSKQQRDVVRKAKALTETVWDDICAEFDQAKATTQAIKEVLEEPSITQADLTETD